MGQSKSMLMQTLLNWTSRDCSRCPSLDPILPHLACFPNAHDNIRSLSTHTSYPDI